MSEDLRYHFTEDDPDPAPPFSAADGWKQMEMLLDEEMPEKRRPLGLILLPYAVAASLLLVGLFAGLQLGNKTARPLSKLPQQKNAQPAAGAGSDDKLATNKTAATTQPGEAHLSKTENNNNHTKQPIATIYGSQSSTTQKAVTSATNDPYNLMLNNTAAGEKKPELATVLNNGQAGDGSSTSGANSQQPVLALNENKATPLLSTNSGKGAPEITIKKKPVKGSWQLLAGVGVNMATASGSQSAQPYPVIETRYNLNKRLYVSTGVSVFAPSATTASGVEKTVMVNDFANNISHYDENLNYNHLSYLDVPLMAGINLGKNFSVQGGVQMSWLLNSRSSKSVESFDMMENRVNIDYTTLVFAPTMVPPVESTVKLNKTDLRYVAGVQYALHRTTIGLQYQQGFKRVVSGDKSNGKKNNLLSLKVNFRIK